VKKTIILSVLALCLLASLGSAWEMTFEDCDTDAGDPTVIMNVDGSNPKLVDSGGSTWVWAQDNTYSGAVDTSSTNPIKIYHGFTDRVGFTFYDTQTSTSGYTYLVLSFGLNYDNGTAIISPQIIGSYQAASGHHRCELINNGLEGIEVYVDGTFIKTVSFPYDFNDIGQIEIRPHSKSDSPTYGGGKLSPVMVDDIVIDGDYVLGLKDTVNTADSTLYWSYGVPAMDQYTYTASLIGPDESVLQSWTLSTGLGTSSNGIKTIDTNTYVQDAGTYTIRLYGQDTAFPDQPVYFLASKTFSYDIPLAASMSLETPEVSPGEQVKVYCYQAAGYTLEFDGPASNDYQSHTISGDSVNVYFSIPSNSVSGRGVVILRDPTGNKIDYEYFDVVGGVGGDSEISFDEQAYVNTDKVGIWYSDLPAGCQVQLTGTKAGSSTKVINKIYTKSGTGVFYYQLSGEDISSLYVVAAYDGELLDSDAATIASGDDYVISGTVYDANTLAPISGASVGVGGWVKYTDEVGRYDMSVSAGTKNLVVGADGYNTLSTTIDIISVSTQKNIYLVPITTSEGDTGIIYGACADYDTGQAIETAYIQISNSSGVTYSALGRSSTGAYIFEGLPNGSVWTLKASKKGYDNYQQQITVNGSTFHLIRLVSQDNGSSTSGDDDDSSTETNTERPGREAAKDAMEEFEALAPGLIGLVVIKVIKELMK